MTQCDEYHMIFDGESVNSQMEFTVYSLSLALRLVPRL